MPRRHHLLLAVAGLLLVAACGGESTTATDSTDVATKGVVDKTGSGSSSGSGSGSSAASKSATGKKLQGSVCQLLTVAEAEAVLKSGQTLTTYDPPADADSDRSCAYLFAQTAPLLVLSLQGELEPVDWNGLKAIPGSKAVSVRNAEAVFVSLTNVTYVQKNGLAVAIQVVVPPAGETYESAGAKLAQSIAARLP